FGIAFEEDNIEKLKGKLNRDSSSLYKRLYSDVVKKPVEELSWKDPLASQVISDESDIVKNLPMDIKKGFNKISRNMVPAQRPIVQELCREFIEDFRRNIDRSKNIWNNPAFKPEVAKTLNEGTTSEKQSIASANRKGEGGRGRRPDIMFLGDYLETTFELMYAEFSRLFCSPQKKTDDEIKLWREVNDGLYWVRQSLNPDKEQFGIVGIQVAGNIFHLNVLVRDKVNVHRYYHLQPVEIPVQCSAEGVVSRFIETLLVLRNILITNLSLLYHAPVPKSERQKEDFSTSKIVLLEEQNFKLVSKITEFREKNVILLIINIKVKAKNVKLKQVLKKYEVRFVNLKQKDKEKISLIAKLDNDINEIKQSSANTNVSSKINPNNTPKQMLQNDLSSSKNSENIFNNIFNSNTYQPICTKPNLLENKELTDFLTH
ncbi:17802_t:CDS:2, partial [Cetraspora pellucida]